MAGLSNGGKCFVVLSHKIGPIVFRAFFNSNLKHPNRSASNKYFTNHNPATQFKSMDVSKVVLSEFPNNS